MTKLANTVLHWYTTNKWFNPVFRRRYKILMWTTLGITFVAAIVITLLGLVFHTSVNAGYFVFFIVVVLLSAILGSAFTLTQVDNYERKQTEKKPE